MLKIVEYPISHKNDVWNPPRWVFFPGLTLYASDAAKLLNWSANTLKKYTDALGLTVYRNPRTKRRRYDVKEIMAIKKAMDEGRIKDILIQNGYGETQGKQRPRRRRAV